MFIWFVFEFDKDLDCGCYISRAIGVPFMDYQKAVKYTTHLTKPFKLMCLKVYE